jgi:hypothetical protein
LKTLKHDDGLDLDNDLDSGSGMDDLSMDPNMPSRTDPSAFDVGNQSPYGQNQQGGSQFQGFQNNDVYQSPLPMASQGNNMSDQIISKEIEVLSSKMDALRASVDSINQRMINIEYYLRQEKENKYKW